MKKLKGIKFTKIVLIILAISMILAYIYIDTVKTVVNVIFISFILAYSLKPIRNWISEKTKISRRIASILIILAILALIVVGLYLIIPTLVTELGNIDQLVDEINNSAREICGRFNINIDIYNNIYQQLVEKVTSLKNDFSNNIIDNSFEGIGNILAFAVVPVIAYYLLVDGESIYNRLLLILPTEKRTLTKKVMANIDRVLDRYIISQLLLSLIIGVLTFIVLICFNVKMAPFLAILNGIFNIIPYFGPILGGVPAIFMALLDSPIKALWITGAVYLIQQIEGDILAPKITGDTTNMHPIIIIILLLIGEKIGGIIGMVIAVPVAVIIKVIYDDINYYFY